MGSVTRVCLGAPGRHGCLGRYQVLVLSCLAAGASSFAPNFLPHAPHVSVRPASRPAAPRAAVTGQQERASDPTARGAVRPDTDLVSLATKYAWGQQGPGVPLPYPIAPGAPPEPAPMVTQEHLDTLARDGVVHIRGVLSDAWVGYLRNITDWQVAHPHIWAVPGIASNLYDYIQRSAWTTNTGFADFLYYSPVASALARAAECGWFPEGDARGFHEIRVSTDLLMVNPNKGFKWHQDNQNGPLTCGHGGKLDGLRFWVTMDETPAAFGAPVYLRRSHENSCINKEDVFVQLEGGLLPYAKDVVEFRPMPGDMLIWHPRSIHKVDGAPGGDWKGRKRRVLGGTVAVDDALYQGEKKALFSDMGSHDLRQGDPLKSPFFPIIYPRSDPAEREFRARGGVGRSFAGLRRMVGTLVSAENVAQFGSWARVVQEGQKLKEVNEPLLWRERASEEVRRGLARQGEAFSRIASSLPRRPAPAVPAPAGAASRGGDPPGAPSADIRRPPN